MTYTARIQKIYETLYDSYGPQGWWPLTRSQQKNHAHPLQKRGYHPLDYSLPIPTDHHGQLEICIGAILTQNTSWTQVEKVLHRLTELQMLHGELLLLTETDILKEAIKPSGYFNQKAKKINAFTLFFNTLNGRIPARQELLDIWGIGPETADSMLLYAFHVPVFVVDAYTRRIFSRIFYAAPPHHLQDYHHLQHLFHSSYDSNHVVFKEYHALIVQHAKTHCKKQPACRACPLASHCEYPSHHASPMENRDER